MNEQPEKKTRRELIKPLLKKAGWAIINEGGPIPSKGNFAVEEYPTKSGPVDYAFIIDNDIIGIVEAKKESESVYGVLTQAKRYARDVEGKYNFSIYKVPFIYSSNGKETYFEDLREEQSRSRKVSAFHKPEALLDHMSKNVANTNKWLINNKLNENYICDKGCNPYALRYYQIEAVDAIEKALQKRKEKMFLGMATGTGKTVTALALLYRMLKSKRFKRILFLVDRVELANQALAALASFEPEPGQKFDKIYEVFASRIPQGKEWESLKITTKKMPEEKIKNPRENDAHIFVSTIQGMYRLLTGQKEPEKEIEADLDYEKDINEIKYNEKIPIHAFDLIISDECHRSIYNKWRLVLDYFDAVQVGLTATPALHTNAYFEGNFVYNYPLEKAVQEGYLVDYDVVHIDTKITMEGLKLKKGTQIKVIDNKTKDAFYAKLPDEFIAEPKSLEKRITAIDRNRKIVKEFAKVFREQGQNKKTLFFAVNDRHADRITKLLREEFSENGDSFIEKITYKTDKAPDMIKAFRNRNLPMIAVTVDMITTGVDIPKIENIVFVRPVNSRILFEQMMGRGTRKCDEIYKTHFVVFDTLKLLEFMKNNKLSEFIEPPQSQTLPIREVIDYVDKGFNREQHINIIVRKLQRIAKNVSEEGREQFAQFIPNSNITKFASELKENLQNNFTKTFSLFKNEVFLDLLENYPRKKRYFYEDEITQDKVLSVRESLTTIDGKEIKPADYLKEFEEFVIKNEEKIDALRVLLDRPQDFDIKDLEKLKNELRKHPYMFEERRLRKAAHNNVADIIAFVNMAVRHVPLASPEQRVEIAFHKIINSKIWQFTEKQIKWLELIKKHVLRNLIIREEDFNEQHALSRKGTFEDWNSIFNNKLPALIKTINKEVLTA